MYIDGNWRVQVDDLVARLAFSFPCCVLVVTVFRSSPSSVVLFFFFDLSIDGFMLLLFLLGSVMIGSLSYI